MSPWHALTLPFEGEGRTRELPASACLEGSRASIPWRHSPRSRESSGPWCSPEAKAPACRRSRAGRRASPFRNSTALSGATSLSFAGPCAAPTRLFPARGFWWSSSSTTGNSGGRRLPTCPERTSSSSPSTGARRRGSCCRHSTSCSAGIETPGCWCCPADHHVESEDVLRRAMLAAARAVRRPGAPLVLLGMAGEDADREYGWILPSGGPSVGLRAVLSFVEKPATERSRELAGRGALANSLIFAFRGRTLVRLYRDALPELLRVLVPVVRAGYQEAFLREVYDEIPSCDFSRAVLERCSSSLAVLAVPPCGWSDLGTPSRLVRFLGRQGQGHMASAAEVNVS